ncbi:iron donor protein CyaY, partial [Salmonella enterica subsp. enterica serovar Infantis]
SKIIINRQEQLHQVCLATNQGGYHFELKDDEWVCDRSVETFWDLLEQAATQQAGVKVSFRCFICRMRFSYPAYCRPGK